MKKRPSVLLNVCFILLVAVVCWLIYYAMPEAQAGIYKKTIDEIDQKSVDLIDSMNKYLTTVAFGVIGVLGNVLIGEIKVKQNSTTSIAILFLSVLFAIVSVFFGFMGYEKLFETISYHLVDIHSAQLSFAQLLQFITLFISVLLFLYYMFHNFVSSRI